MKINKKKKAYILFKERFTKAALEKIYEDKVSSSLAVGRDGIRQRVFKTNLDHEIDLILKKSTACTYRFTIYKLKLISKGANRTPRVISIPTIRDRLVLRVLNDILSAVFKEASLQRPHVYIKSIREFFEKPCDDMAFVRLDIKEFFPTVNHDTLIRKVRRRMRKTQLIHLIKSAISNKTAGVKFNGKGVPQGLSISNILSSIYLHDIDVKFSNRYTYFRYVDDILVICKADKAPSIFEEIKTDIEALGLTCHPLESTAKSQIIQVEKGVDYLGFHLTPSKISVRDSSYTRMLENLLAVFTQYKYVEDRKKNEGALVWRLNLKITGCIYDSVRYGWLFFFSQIDDLRQLGRLDYFVSAQLRKRDLGHLKPKVKKFLRSYHEIRLNLRETSYIPKFDDLEISDMIKELSQAQGNPEDDYRLHLSESQIRDSFTTLIKRTTRRLERDLVEALS